MAAPTASPIPIYQGTLPSISVPVTPSTGVPNPSTTEFPVNYKPVIPAYGVTMASAVSPPLYYWACLRRPANPFAPVSASNPMVVVDSMRFPYIEATTKISGTRMSASGVVVPDVTLPLAIGSQSTPPGVPTALVTPTAGTSDAAYSIQRFQPYRGGHAVPIPQNVATTTVPAPVDSRYGYSEQIVVPGTALTSGSLQLGTQAIYYIDTTVTPNVVYPASLQIAHTIGWANEYEQGSTNALAENWDYFPFNDRDFTSVAELLLVPGCSPGLFTKQFVEFAPSYNNITNVFSQVTPLSTPTILGSTAAGRIRTLREP